MPTTPLKVIALISGGKDSLYSLLHCIENGHKVVALANLHPQTYAASELNLPQNAKAQEEEGEDLNSFMYQTVGHTIIPLYAQALRLPLYRRAIKGSAVQTGRYYDAAIISDDDLDETEDLVLLLKEVLQHHPEANAVSSGAILSTYQRTRIESVAVRLGLVPLAYLWQYPALPPPSYRPDSLTGLLDDMSATGCDARIIKIASGGIGEDLLGSNVASAQTKTRLVSGMAPFFPVHEFWLRGAVLGEGGEYETLALNGPPRVWKRRIEIDESETKIVTGEGGTSSLSIGRASLVEQVPTTKHQDRNLVCIPSMLDERFTAVEFELRSLVAKGSTAAELQNSSGIEMGSSPSKSITESYHIGSNTISLANLTAGEAANGAAAKSQMEVTSKRLANVLTLISVDHKIFPPISPSNIISSTLLLASMSDFATVNTVYASMFTPGESNPPARLTVAADLPDGVKVSLNVVLDKHPRDQRRGLHVQSRSYWAPSNIGPYSQAICEPVVARFGESLNVHDAGLLEVVHVAGQIPLLPQTMEIWEGNFHEQSVLSLQHLWRVGQDRGVDIWPWGVAFVVPGVERIQDRAATAARVWQAAHTIGTPPKLVEGEGTDSEDGNDETDVWDLQYTRQAAFQSRRVPITIGEHLHILPNSNVFESTSGVSHIPTLIAAEVRSLPRGAPIEWWSIGLAHLPKSPAAKPRIRLDTKSWQWGSAKVIGVLPDEDHDDGDIRNRKDEEIKFITCVVNQPSPVSRSSFGEISSVIDELITGVAGSVGNSRYYTVQGTAFISPGSGWDCWSSIRSQQCLRGVAQIPCRNVWACRPLPKSGSSNTDVELLSLALTLRVERMVEA